VNTSVPWPNLSEAETRVLAMQTKLHNSLYENAESRMR
jgi:hypothetical protein